MPRRDPRLSLLQMRDHAREAINLLRGKTREDLERDRILGLAVVRLLEILGEAANRVPGDERTRLPKVPWREIISLRNRLIHAYDNVDIDVVWEIVSGDLPGLVEALDYALDP